MSDNPVRVGGGMASAPTTSASPRRAPAGLGSPDPAVPNLATPRPSDDFTGRLVKGDGEGEVRGWIIVAATKERIEFRGFKDPRGHGYLLVGRRVCV